MSESAVLDLSLAGEPRLVVVVARNLSHDDWYRIALQLADRTPQVGAPLSVQPDRLLRERLPLQGLLTELGIELSADDGIRSLLRGSQIDQRAFNAAIREQIFIYDDGARRHDDDGRRVVRELRPFQRRDFERLANLRHGANFSVPGAGKTTVTYALHARERAAGRATKLLVIAPLSAFGAWEEEVNEVLDPPLLVARWMGDTPDADVILVNYQRLPSAIGSLTNLMLNHSTHLVVDEAHRAKRGAAGEWGRALLAVAPFATRRDVLTGTPAPNQPRDLVSIFDILWPGNIARSAIPSSAFRNDPTQAEMRGLSTAIAPLYVRTTKNELGLRNPFISIDFLAMSELQQQIYDAMLDRYAGIFDLDRRDRAMFAQMGEVAMYLLQAACSPRLLSESGDPARAYRFPSLAIPAGSRLASLIDNYADHEIPAKIERACRIIDANVELGRKTLVWSNFPGNLLDLERQLAGLNPALIYGAIPSYDRAEPGVRTRERELERFRNHPDCWVMLANPAAMSEGVSLHLSCNDAIYIERTFNAGQYLQSLDRIHRLGLPDDTITRITILTSVGTIDERVNSRVEDKARRLAAILDDPFLVQMTLPDDDDAGEMIDEELDLTEILDHLARGPHH